MEELFTPGGEHHEIVDGEGLMMTTATNAPLRSPERTLDHKTQWNFLSDFFLREMVLIELELCNIPKF